jgi:hypothetical protein
MYVQYVFKEQHYLHASSYPTFRSLIFQAPSPVQEQKAQQQRFLSACFAEIISTVSSYVIFSKFTLTSCTTFEGSVLIDLKIYESGNPWALAHSLTEIIRFCWFHKFN